MPPPIKGSGGGPSAFNAIALATKQDTQASSKTSPAPKPSPAPNQTRGNPKTDFPDIFEVAGGLTGSLQADAKAFSEGDLTGAIKVVERLATSDVAARFLGQDDGIITLKELEYGRNAFKDLMNRKDGIAVLSEKLGLGKEILTKQTLTDMEKAIDFLFEHGKAIASRSGKRDQIYVDDIRDMWKNGMLKDSRVTQ